MSAGQPDDVGPQAEALLRCDVYAVERVAGGGNNEIFRIDTAQGRFAFKRYLVSDGERRDRIGREYEALKLLVGGGETNVPRPIAADPSARIAIYEWITGAPVGHLNSCDIDAALAFLARLRHYGELRGADELPLAVEACLDAASLRAQIAVRVRRLTEVSVVEPELALLMAEQFLPVWHELDKQFDSSEPLPRSAQMLSPSDFGTHNMLRRSDDRLVFLDFEYFGWDDPVKLVADIVWHPGSAFGLSERRRFIDGARHIFASDRGYTERFERCAPIFGLRWALIVLSEFIPERWLRRQRAGETSDWDTVKARQLAKAARIIERSRRTLA